MFTERFKMIEFIIISTSFFIIMSAIFIYGKSCGYRDCLHEKHEYFDKRYKQVEDIEKRIEVLYKVNETFFKSWDADLRKREDELSSRRVK